MSLLRLIDLKKSFGEVAALGGVSLDLAPGSRTAVVGPSGCGKTTLLRLVAGFERPDSGRILLDGAPLAEGPEIVPAHRRGIGLVSQDGALFPHLTVAGNIGFGIPQAPDRDRRIGELAELVGLSERALHRRPHELSGGQQQRVALARALAQKPRLMLLDEPFSALDTGLRVSLRKAVIAMLEAAGVAAILVTHDQAEALSFGDQVAVMEGGRFAQVGTPRELYLRPRTRRVAEFLGEAVILPARLGDGFADCALGRVPVAGGTAGQCGTILLRPEQIALGPAATHGPTARVSGVDFAGAVCSVTVRCGAPECETELTLRCSAFDAPEPGQTVGLAIAGPAQLLD